MSGEERRKKIVQVLSQTRGPVSGSALGSQLQVSRQVIVQDIALLRTEGVKILALPRGYLLQATSPSRIFKTIHADEEEVEELQLIVDCGGRTKDVFVYHRAYGLLKADLEIRSRLDIDRFMENIRSGKSSLLNNITSGYHYYTVMADSEEILDLIQEKLQQRGFLAGLLDYEPVDFWHHE